jgi:tetratricopeptide (TPR) repeat protein
MSNYLNEEDSESEGEKGVGKQTGEPMSEEEKESILAMCASLKTEGNGHFSKGEFEPALQKYTAAVNMLKQADLPKDGLILLNRSATYLALKRYVPALNDANQGTSLPVR